MSACFVGGAILLYTTKRKGLDVDVTPLCFTVASSQPNPPDQGMRCAKFRWAIGGAEMLPESGCPRQDVSNINAVAHAQMWR